MTFRATIEQSGRTATGIRLPPEVVDGLGAGKRSAVKVLLELLDHPAAPGCVLSLVADAAHEREIVAKVRMSISSQVVRRIDRHRENEKGRS
jgi:hypothetical protein